MVLVAPATAVDGIIAGGNTPAWLVQEEEITQPLVAGAISFPLAALTADTTVKIDCHLDMDGIDVTRNATTRERQRMCEKIKTEIKTGETISGSITSIYDQQATSEALINAVYTALPEGRTVYLVRAYGLDAHKPATEATKVDVLRIEVQQRNKNNPVAGEDLEFTATFSADLYLPDVKLTA